MKKYLVSLFLLLTAATLSAQVSVNQDNATPDPSAMLDVKSSDKGLLIPRMSTAQRDAIAAKLSPADLSEAQRRAKVCMASSYQDCD